MVAAESSAILPLVAGDGPVVINKALALLRSGSAGDPALPYPPALGWGDGPKERKYIDKF
jgi:hypothetical protein